MKVYLPNKKFDVRFMFCRFPSKLQHRAVNLADDCGLNSVLFPREGRICVRQPIVPLDKPIRYCYIFVMKWLIGEFIEYVFQYITQKRIKNILAYG